MNIETTVTMKECIEIKNNGFKNSYVYCPENECIYIKGKTVYPLFDYYRDFENMDIETILKICQKILNAYEIGIEKEQNRIIKNITNILGIEG